MVLGGRRGWTSEIFWVGIWPSQKVVLLKKPSLKLTFSHLKMEEVGSWKTVFLGGGEGRFSAAKLLVSGRVAFRISLPRIPMSVNRCSRRFFQSSAWTTIRTWYGYYYICAGKKFAMLLQYWTIDQLLVFVICTLFDMVGFSGFFKNLLLDPVPEDFFWHANGIWHLECLMLSFCLSV